MTERTPPYDIEAERAVIGSALLDNQVIEAVEVIISAGDFYTEAHKKIFGAIITHYKKTPIDIITIGKLLDEQMLKNIGGMSYISSLAAYDLSQPIDEIIENAQKESLNINPISTENHIKTAGEIAKRTIDLVEVRSKGTGLYGISTGLTDLDEITGGISPLKLTILAGRPGMGKSALAMNIAREASLKENPARIVSLEMLNEDIMVRIFASITKIESRQIMRGYLRATDWPKLVSAASDVAGTA